MKAAFIRKPGKAETIEWGELPVPKIQGHEVLVKVSAVSVNLVDTYIRSGKYTFENMPFPFIIGRDMVGVVEKVGPLVESFKPGQRVWCNSLGIHGRQGSFAEYIAVDEDLLYHAPEGVDDKAIVSAVHAGATACLGLIREAQLKAGETIFVNGGAGSIGSAVIQLAKARGSRVFASAGSPEKAKWCKSLGADLVLDYHKDNLVEKVKESEPSGVDVFWDTSQQPNFDISVEMLANKGRIILMAGGEAHPPFPVGSFYRKECAMKGFTLNKANSTELRQYSELINLCLERGQLQTKIAHTLPLSEAVKAHQLIESKPEVWGKIVLTV